MQLPDDQKSPEKHALFEEISCFPEETADNKEDSICLLIVMIFYSEKGKQVMDFKKNGKQIMDFYKTAFDNSFNTMCAIQEQAEKMVTAALQQAPLFPKEGNKLINDWLNAYKQGRDSYKATVDENFRKMDEYFSASEENKTKAGK